MSGEPDKVGAGDKTLNVSGNINEPTVDEIKRLMETPQQDPLIGTKLAGGRYEILEVLGSGGMSVVYKARQELVDRLVAIKTLKLQLLTDDTLIKRFDREVKTLSKLNHPNIVTVYDCVLSETGQPYFVMDYLQGRSLQELLAAQGRLPIHRAREIFVQVCSAVDHAHRQGIVHRDLKPANIMLVDLGSQDFVKVVDFGLAKLGEQSQRLTQTGELWGSPLYMSPEQCSGHTLDARSDIYSFGAVMYETLTGQVPFRGNSFLDTITKQVHEKPPPFAELEPPVRLPPEVEAIVMKALAKNPDERFASMADLRTAVQEGFPAGADTGHLSISEQLRIATGVTPAGTDEGEKTKRTPSVTPSVTPINVRPQPAGSATKPAKANPLLVVAAASAASVVALFAVAFIVWTQMHRAPAPPPITTPSTAVVPIRTDAKTGANTTSGQSAAPNRTTGGTTGSTGTSADNGTKPAQNQPQTTKSTSPQDPVSSRIVTVGSPATTNGADNQSSETAKNAATTQSVEIIIKPVKSMATVKSAKTVHKTHKSQTKAPGEKVTLPPPVQQHFQNDDQRQSEDWYKMQHQ